MMTKATLACLPGVLLLLGGCNATGPLYTEGSRLSERQAELVIYREKLLLGSATYPTVSVNGEVLGQLRQGGYLRYRQIGDGDVSISVTGHPMVWPWQLPQHRMALKRGETSYLNLDLQADETTILVKCAETKERIEVCERTTSRPGWVVPNDGEALAVLPELKLSSNGATSPRMEEAGATQ